MYQMPNGLWRLEPRVNVATHTFFTIPLELRRQIISYVTRPSDLKSLCLTSKNLRNLAVGPLYRNVRVYLGGKHDARISGLISPSNTATKHIRDLQVHVVKPDDAFDTRFGDEEAGDQYFNDSKGSIQQAHMMLRMLIEALPRDILQLFYWGSWDPFSRDNWILLCKYQTRLTGIEMSPLDQPYASMDPPLSTILEGLTKINSLTFYAESLDVLEASQKVLKAYPSARQLSLCSKWQDTESKPDDFDDTESRPGLIFHKIFSHLMPSETSSPMELEKLELEDIDLRYADRYLTKVIRFNLLNALHLENCPAPDGLFAQLKQPQNVPSGLRTLYWLHKDTTEPHMLSEFERLLEKLPTLAWLHIEICRARRQPSIQAVSTSGGMLRSLLVRAHDTEGMLLRYSAEETEEICTKCPGLRGLSIAFPTLTLSHSRSSLMSQNFFEHTRRLPNLVTLNIQNLPKTELDLSEESPNKYESNPLYEFQLQRLAQWIFLASDANARSQSLPLKSRSKLAVIAFGANGHSRYREGVTSLSLNQICFTRGERIDALGRRMMMATMTLDRHLKYCEPAPRFILNNSLKNTIGGAAVSVP